MILPPARLLHQPDPLPFLYDFSLNAWLYYLPDVTIRAATLTTRDGSSTSPPASG